MTLSRGIVAMVKSRPRERIAQAKRHNKRPREKWTRPTASAAVVTQQVSKMEYHPEDSKFSGIASEYRQDSGVAA